MLSHTEYGMCRGYSKSPIELNEHEGTDSLPFKESFTGHPKRPTSDAVQFGNGGASSSMPSHVNKGLEPLKSQVENEKLHLQLQVETSDIIIGIIAMIKYSSPSCSGKLKRHSADSQMTENCTEMHQASKQKCKGVAMENSSNTIADNEGAPGTKHSLPPFPTDLESESIKVHVGGEEETDDFQAIAHTSVEDYLNSLGHSKSWVTDDFPELGGCYMKFGNLEDPAATFLDLDYNEMSNEDEDVVAGKTP
ncbi:unnamed protein product [Ilex paraguariensis]|uniref:Uncharacterized protein n=1 Tax=Ilex paraguariensis TaxID=185542 RepID=A0ABC8S3L9_9AQUA